MVTKGAKESYTLIEDETSISHNTKDENGHQSHNNGAKMEQM